MTSGSGLISSSINAKLWDGRGILGLFFESFFDFVDAQPSDSITVKSTTHMVEKYFIGTPLRGIYPITNEEFGFFDEKLKKT